MIMSQYRNSYFSNLITAALILVLVVVISGSVTASSSGGYTGLFEPHLNPEDLPASVGSIYTSSSSSSFTASESDDMGDDMVLKEKVITENRGSLNSNQSATHMIIFEDKGTLVVSCLSGTGVEIFSEKGGEWPENKTFRSDYGESDMVTGSAPLTRDISPGTWYFTLFPLGDQASYDLIARQDTGSSSGSTTGAVPSGSFSTSMGAATFSVG